MLRQKDGTDQLLNTLRQEADLKKKQVFQKGQQADVLAHLHDEHILRIHHLMVEHGKDVRQTLIAKRPGFAQVHQLASKLSTERQNAGKQPFTGSTKDTGGLTQKVKTTERMYDLSKQMIRDTIPASTDMKEVEKAVDQLKRQARAVIHAAVHEELDALYTELGVPVALPATAETLRDKASKKNEKQGSDQYARLGARGIDKRPDNKEAEDAKTSESRPHIRLYISDQQPKHAYDQEQRKLVQDQAPHSVSPPSNPNPNPRSFAKTSPSYSLSSSIDEMDEPRWKHMCNEVRKRLAREPEKVGFAQRIRLKMVVGDGVKEWREMERGEREKAFGEVVGVLRQ